MPNLAILTMHYALIHIIYPLLLLFLLSPLSILLNEFIQSILLFFLLFLFFELIQILLKLFHLLLEILLIVLQVVDRLLLGDGGAEVSAKSYWGWHDLERRIRVCLKNS